MKKERSLFKHSVVIVTAVLIVVTASCLAANSSAQLDEFYTIGEMNKASIIMLSETGIVPKPLAGKIARGIAQVIAEGDQPGAKRPGDYLLIEPRLIEVVGPDASRIHSGRSRQDMLSTTERIFLRDALLATFESLNSSRDKLLTFAGGHIDTIIPAYTHGVQAQPTTLAHYLLAYAESLSRDGERLRQAYARLNLSPLGAAALGTSSFPINRVRLAALLGFEGLVENSYDANHVSPWETNTELASMLAISALAIGNFAQDLHTQYHNPVPWITLKKGPLTGGSSIMPQKQNPMGIEQLRTIASKVIGDAQATFFLPHNASSGMFDYRFSDQTRLAAADASSMYKLLGGVIDNLIVDCHRALEEVDADYSTMTEVADTLQRVGDVPFRIGHHFLSELTTYGRSQGMRPIEIPYEEAVRIFKEVTDGDKLPMTDVQFKAVMSAQNMVSMSRGIGGPQPAEVNRMLAHQRQRLEADRDWVKSQRTKLQDASTMLQRAFTEMAETGSN